MPSRIREIIPSDDDGLKPSTVVIRKWMIEGAWDAWADELDARVSLQTDEQLISKKVMMLQKQRDDAIALAQKAKEYLMEEGFDSSSAAGNVYFKATEEQRKTEGLSDLIERMDKMNDTELSQKIIEMLQRAAENDQIIEAESVPAELESGEVEESQE